MTTFRWLGNLLLTLFAFLLFLAALGFVLANPEPVNLNLVVTAWQVPVGLGASLVAALLAGLLLGFFCGLMLAVSRGSRAKSRSNVTKEQVTEESSR